MAVGVMAISLPACQPERTDVVAQAGPAVLTAEELRSHLAPSLTEADSTLEAQRYIADWRRYHKLLEVMADSFPELTRELRWRTEDYRRKLGAHLLLQRLAQERVDTSVSAPDLVAAYAVRRGEFLAQQPLAMILHLAIDRAALDRPGGLATLAAQRALMLPPAERARALGEWAARLDSAWVTPAQLARYNAPPTTNLLLAPGRMVHVYLDAKQPAERAHFAYVAGLIAPGEPLPLPLAAPLLRRLIVAQRRQAFIEKYERMVAPAP